MQFIRCGNSRVPLEACKVHSSGFMSDGSPINPDSKISDYAHCIDCMEWVNLDPSHTVEEMVVKATKHVARRNTAPKQKRQVVSNDLEEAYLEKCEDIGELTLWLMKLNMPSMMRLAKSIGIKAFGVKKDILIGEIIALEGGK